MMLQLQDSLSPESETAPQSIHEGNQDNNHDSHSQTECLHTDDGCEPNSPTNDDPEKASMTKQMKEYQQFGGSDNIQGTVPKNMGDHERA